MRYEDSNAFKTSKGITIELRTKLPRQVHRTKSMLVSAPAESPHFQEQRRPATQASEHSKAPRANCATELKLKMKPTAVLNSIWLLFASAHLLASTHQALASGVLELELVDLRQLDPASGAASAKQHEAPFRLAVCLKEAFASQLDGPCAFGNASLTLDHLEPARLDKGGANKLAIHKQTTTWPEGEEETPATSRGQMTNVVRVPFSFRWTKSFTIVLTAERQVSALGPAEPADETANRSQSAANANQPHQQQQQQQPGAFALIDRHVLTENEALPSWDASSSRAAWTTRFSRSFKTALIYRFRILCAPNHYGDDCSTFCRPRDDQFGHFKCTPNGQKVCRPGWLGADCAQAKCRAGCNKQHGFCDLPDTCQCRPGWTGERCDECLTYPGCQNGFCLAPWQCVCKLNWAGLLCDQDLNYCATHAPCENNATCQNVAPNRYKCHCPAGFTGVNCQLRVDLPTLTPVELGVAEVTQQLYNNSERNSGCRQSSCLNGGTCLRVGQQLVQISNGTNSTQLDEANGQMILQEQAISLNRSLYRCQCPAGFTGDYCQWAELPAIEVATPPANISDGDSAQTLVNESQLELEGLMAPSFEVALTGAAPANDLFVHQANQRQAPLEMRHLISGVVVASAIGVFCAALLLAWCCLLAIERGKFQLVQMSFVRNHQLEPGQGGACFSASLRRVQAKIRDSFGRSARGGIKPATKLSLDNVLNPARLAPPSYEESTAQALASSGPQAQCVQIEADQQLEHAVGARAASSIKSKSLVKKGALEREMALRHKSAHTKTPPARQIDHSPASCPKHGHLYRHIQLEMDEAATSIEIAYKPPDALD